MVTKPELQRHFKESFIQRKRKDSHTMRVQERINFVREKDEHMRIRKVSIISNSINQQPLMCNESE
jgi:hypothetical protein